MGNLSIRQRAMIGAIKRHVDRKGYLSAYRELTEMVSVKSVPSISGHLDKPNAKAYTRSTSNTYCKRKCLS